MDIFESFATDESKENEGVWTDIGPAAKLKLARSGNRKYARLLSRKVEAAGRTLDLKNDQSDDMSDQIMIEVLANTVLLGWDGITYKGQALPYSLDNAKMLLGVKDFRSLVVKLSSDIDTYKKAKEDAAIKN
jgi:hypothetical protein